jgi:hypothetical protein
MRSLNLQVSRFFKVQKFCLFQINDKEENNMEFWQEIMTYFPFTAILLSDMTRTQKSLLCMRNDVSKTMQFWMF